MVEHFSDEVAVMYLGRIVERATPETLYTTPKHPYTIALLSAIPEPDPRPKRKRIVLTGEVPSPAKPPTGCHFHPRCPLTRERAAQANAADTTEITTGGIKLRVIQKCVNEAPPLTVKGGDSTHVAACWLTE
ncbi:MAG: ABC transporter ATP-binding protein [Tepidisphaeraceae bacterium]